MNTSMAHWGALQLGITLLSIDTALGMVAFITPNWFPVVVMDASCLSPLVDLPCKLSSFGFSS